MKKYFSSYWIRSAFFTFLQRFSLTIFGFVNFIILIRDLTKAQMGTWALFLVVTTIFESTKANLLKNAHIKYVAGSDGSDKTAIASSSLILNSFISLLFILFLFFFSGLVSTWLHTGNDLENMLKWFIPGIVFMIFFSHLEAVCQSHFDFKGIFAGYFIRQLIFFSIILCHHVFKIPFSLVHLAIYQSGSIMLGVIFLYFFSRKHLLYRFDPSIVWIKKLLGFGGYIFGSGILASVFTNLDQLMIAKFTTSSSLVANYNAASRINALVDIPSYAASEILMPKVSQATNTERLGKVKYMYERIVGVLLSFTTPIALFIIMFPNFVINIIAGSQYADSAFILQLYMVAGIIRPIQNQAANILMYIGKARLCFIINAAYLLGNLTVNYICLKQFGFYGAAIGTVIMCFLGMIVWYYILKKNIGVEMSNVWKYMLDTYRMIFTRVNLLFSKVKQVHA